MEMEESASVDLGRRYKDAYRNAESTVRAGQNLKKLGIAVALLVGFGSLTQVKTLGVYGCSGAVASVGIIFLPFFALGALLAAQGQILKASLDTAVNTSPLLSREELVRLLSETKAPQKGARWVSCTICDRQILSTSATEQGDTWYCSEHAPSAET